MRKFDPYRTPAYLRAKRELYGKPCWRCGAFSTTVDHVPSLADAPSPGLWRGELLPCCSHHNFQAGQAVKSRREREARHGTTSRAW